MFRIYQICKHLNLLEKKVFLHALTYFDYIYKVAAKYVH